MDKKKISKIMAIGITTFFLSSQAFALGGSTSNKKAGSADLGSPSGSSTQSYDRGTTSDRGTTKDKSFVDHGTAPSGKSKSPDLGSSESRSPSRPSDMGTPSRDKSSIDQSGSGSGASSGKSSQPGSAESQY
jgi:hypothetical protein